MEEEKKDSLEKENDLEEIDEDEETLEDPEYVTRNINLDELYDGAINNTVVLDPITNNEILVRNKKPNFTVLGIVMAVAILLLLYYVNNKTDFGRETKDVEPKTTVKTTITNAYDNGVLTCTYSSKSDAESQNVTFVANYSNAKITTSNFNFVAVVNQEGESAIINDLKNQYETFYINNVATKGNSINFDKTGKGFTFNIETDYSKAIFEDISLVDGQTVLYVKPQASDTVSYLSEAYAKNGFACSTTAASKE